VRTYPAHTGPFPDALHYELEEIESLCLAALSSVALLPSSPSPVRIERFVEKHFHLTPEYRDDLPPGILGFSEIDASGPLRIVLNPSLTERRLRTTIAHEAGHCLLHAVLYRAGTADAILCRDSDVARASYGGRWWEYQANVAIGALLLPRPLLLPALEPHLRSSRAGGRVLPAAAMSAAIETVASVFDVNPVVARLRIEALSLVA
jgi:Zn-dependent peptidase ImmA (M78 family)